MNTHIEDLIERLATSGLYLFSTPLQVLPDDYNVLYSLASQIERGHGLTERQRKLALRLVSKYASELNAEFDVYRLLSSPTFKLPVRILSSAKNVTIKNINGSESIAIQFPYDEHLVSHIKKQGNGSSGTVLVEKGYPTWNYDERAWILQLSEANISFVGTLIDESFELDEQFQSYLSEVRKIQENVEDYIPMVSYRAGKFVFSNASDRIPQPDGYDLVKILLLARKHGITCWDDAIDIALKEVNPTIHKFLSSPAGTTPLLNAPMDDIKDLLEFSENVLFVIPGGSELEHLSYSHQYLKSIGHQDDEMTVLFRLESSFGLLCNSYIKENRLNSPIIEKTKFVFISGKITKPLIESGKEFDLVVHFGTNSAHYTLKQFIKQHHNVISMSLLNNAQKDLNIGDL